MNKINAIEKRLSELETKTGHAKIYVRWYDGPITLNGVEVQPEDVSENATLIEVVYDEGPPDERN